MPSHQGFAVSARLLILTLLCLALFFTFGRLIEERQVEWAKSKLALPNSALAFADDLPPEEVAPRAALALALRAARTASSASSLERRSRLLDYADRGVAVAIKSRPRWGEAWVVAAYASMLANGTDDPRTILALARSLEFSPYLMSAAEWRVGLGAATWNALDARSRMHVLDEAQWLSHNAKSDAARIRRNLGTGAAHEAYRRRELQTNESI